MINRIEITDTEFGIAVEFFRGEVVASDGTLQPDCISPSGPSTLGDLTAEALAGFLGGLVGRRTLEMSVNGSRLGRWAKQS